MSSPISYATPASSADDDHLRLLSIFYYVWGGLIALFSSLFIIHIVLGIVIVSNPAALNSNNPNNAPPPAGFGLLFIAIGAVAVLLGWTIGGLTVFAGRSIAQRRRWLFVLIMAGLHCLSFPFGTVLGVFTFIVLLRDPVKAQFGELTSAPPPPSPSSLPLPAAAPVETPPPPGV